MYVQKLSYVIPIVFLSRYSGSSISGGFFILTAEEEHRLSTQLCVATPMCYVTCTWAGPNESDIPLHEYYTINRSYEFLVFSVAGFFRRYFSAVIPTATKANAPTINRLNFSPGINIADSMAPETGVINLYILISPALLYFKIEYHSAKATAERIAE